jgi:hypothetical protein
MYAYTANEVFRTRVEETLRRIDRPMAPLEFYRQVAPLVSALKSGHTYVAPPGWAEHLKSNGRFYPLDIHWHGEEVILAHYYGPGPLPLGGTIVSINDRPAAKLLLQFSSCFPAEGQEGNPFELERPTVLQQALWAEFQNADLRVEISGQDGHVRQTRIPPITLKEALKERMPHHDEGLFSYRYLAEFQAALVRIESFSMAHASDFQRFLAQTFAEIRSRKVNSLVLDLRDNPGGASIGVRGLLAYLTDRDVLLQEGESPLARAFFSPRVRDLPPFGGHVFVLIGKRTASAAMGCAAAVRYYRLGTLVGEETAERMQFFGESRQFTLPHSGLTYAVASDRTVVIGGKGQSGGLKPDREITQDPRDTAKGLDTVLSFTLKIMPRPMNSEEPM